MSELRRLQQELADALRSPVMPHVTMLRGDAVADEASRLAVYHHGYRMRLREALATEFPALARLAGRGFAAMLDAYVAEHPSTHFNIRWHGEGLAAFLATTSPWHSRPALADAARLDWAISLAFDAADQVTVHASELACLPPDEWASLRVQLLPHARLIRVESNADAFRRAADQGAPRPSSRRLEHPRHLLVWRPALEVRYRRVARDELPALQYALHDDSFAQWCEREAERHGVDTAVPRMATWLMRWLGEGLIGRIATR
jgi:hypothetical protein